MTTTATLTGAQSIFVNGAQAALDIATALRGYGIHFEMVVVRKPSTFRTSRSQFTFVVPAGRELTLTY